MGDVCLVLGAWWEEGKLDISIVRATIGHMLAPSPPSPPATATADAADTHHLACPVHHLLLFESLQFLRIPLSGRLNILSKRRRQLFDVFPSSPDGRGWIFLFLGVAASQISGRGGLLLYLETQS